MYILESRTKPQPQKHGKASPKQGGQVNLKSTPESVKSLPKKPPIEYSEIPINTEIEVRIMYVAIISKEQRVQILLNGCLQK